MQDDFYIITIDGWKAETSRVIEVDKKGKEKDKGWNCDLIPKSFIVARYFAEEQEATDGLAIEIQRLGAELTELEEEHSGDDGVFVEFDKVNKAAVTSRFKELKTETNTEEEAEILKQWIAFSDELTTKKKQLKMAEIASDLDAYNKYPNLTLAEIKTLVVEDKWLKSLENDIRRETGQISQGLTQRLKELAERYETPVPNLTDKVADMEEKVNQHLEKMGFQWK